MWLEGTWKWHESLVLESVTFLIFYQTKPMLPVSTMNWPELAWFDR